DSRYRVQRGDSLSRIAKRVWGTDSAAAIRALLAANPYLRGDANRLQADDELTIPGSPVAAGAPRVADRSSPGRETRSPDGAAVASAVRPAKQPLPKPEPRRGASEAAPERGARAYVIRVSDTLEKIA